jgi:hypothetical protein
VGEVEMRLVAVSGILSAVLMVAGCGHRSSADVSMAPGIATQAVAVKRDPATVRVVEEDITDRKYETIGDIEVSVSKNNIFESDPTPQMVKAKLAEKAAELGGDAVVFARYGTVGMSAFSWGSINGKGRAVRYVP